MKRTRALPLLLCVLAVSSGAFGFSQKDQAELLKNADYRETWQQYQALFERAKSAMSSEDFAVFRARENDWLYSDAHDREANDIMSDGLGRTDAYASVLAMRIDEAESLLDRAAVILQGDGVSGLYRMKNGTLRGELLVRPSEDGEYVVEVVLTNNGEPAGCFEGSGKPADATLAANGDLLVEEYDPEKDSAALTLTFDGTGATVAAPEKFRRDCRDKKWLDGGVAFDGTYVRQTSVFEK